MNGSSWWSLAKIPSVSVASACDGRHLPRPNFTFPQITARDLDIAVVGQLPSPKFPLGDEFEPGPVKMVGFEAAFRREGLSESSDWNTRLETRTTPSYSPTPMPNWTAFRSGFHRAAGGKRKNMNR
jgi:hypothetical protein